MRAIVATLLVPMLLGAELAPAEEAAPSAPTVVIRAGHLVDTAAGAVRDTAWIVVSGELEEFLRKDRDLAQVQRDNFRKAVKAGVKMTMGTDTGVHPHQDAPRQLSYMVRYGMTPMQALQAATVNGADAIGLRGEIGTIAPGAYADIIGVRGDPLADVSVLEKVGFVMKGGKVYTRP